MDSAHSAIWSAAALSAWLLARGARVCDDCQWSPGDHAGLDFGRAWAADRRGAHPAGAHAQKVRACWKSFVAGGSRIYAIVDFGAILAVAVAESIVPAREIGPSPGRRWLQNFSLTVPGERPLADGLSDRGGGVGPLLRGTRIGAAQPGGGARLARHRLDGSGARPELLHAALPAAQNSAALASAPDASL